MTAPLDLNELRARILAGGTYTPEELKQALAQLRTNRTEVATSTITKRAKKAADKTPMSDADLDASLASLGLNL